MSRARCISSDEEEASYIDNELLAELLGFLRDQLDVTSVCLRPASKSDQEDDDAVPSLAVSSFLSVLDSLSSPVVEGLQRGEQFDGPTAQHLTEICRVLMTHLHTLYPYYYNWYYDPAFDETNKTTTSPSDASLSSSLRARPVLVPDSKAVGALHKVLSDLLPLVHRTVDIVSMDGSPAEAILPPCTDERFPHVDVMVANVRKLFPKLRNYLRMMGAFHEQDPRPLIDVFQEGGLQKLFGQCISGHTAEECATAFLSEGALLHAENQEAGGHRDLVMVCAFAGVQGALQSYVDKKSKTENNDVDCHSDYEEDEPEMVFGWSGSWLADEQPESRNELFFGVKLGSILKHAEAYARHRKSQETPPSGSSVSSHNAKFHIDFAEEDTDNIDTDEATNMRLCRAKRVVYRYFNLARDDAYANNFSCQDGLVGFTHKGHGWKNREFYGKLYKCPSADGQQWESLKLFHEFWSTPDLLFADDENKFVWIQGDSRIKGYDLSEGLDNKTVNDVRRYVFEVKDTNACKAAVFERGDKRQKLEAGQFENERGCFLRLGGTRLSLLKQGYIQEWDLGTTTVHDGISRMVSMDSLDEDFSQWPGEDVIDLSEGTWMDDTGMAEVSRGVPATWIRAVNIRSPESVGYLPNHHLAFAYGFAGGMRQQASHSFNGRIPIFNSDLREACSLVGLSGKCVNIVQRPCFADGRTFVANDETCVKIFDLRSGRAMTTIKERCVEAVPMSAGDGKFVYTQLRRGRGGRVWDLRMGQALYSLPVQPVEFSRATSFCPKSQVLVCGDGQGWFYGRDSSESSSEWEDAWEPLRSLEQKSNNCTIM